MFANSNRFVTIVAVVLALQGIVPVRCWNNGLALTPPMGWLSWMRYACNIDCDTYPHECINEDLYKNMIDRIAKDGYLELGYNYVNIDDCWMEKKRDPNNSRLVADKKRFPSGIKALADYAHSKKVLLGIYEDVGTMTCGGYPGTRDITNTTDYTSIDAQTFSEWGVDSLKLDGCYQSPYYYPTSYPRYKKALSQQKHKLVYACSWPAYIYNKITEKDFQEIVENCNYFRNYGDIVDSFQSVLSIIDFYGQNSQLFAKYHGPDQWFDPDMLIIGNEGLSYEQSKTQMAFWCLWSAPLLMSNDLRTIKPEFKAILQNKELIAINQDKYGKMGQLVVKHKTSQVWVKELAPLKEGYEQYVVLYFNTNTLGVRSIFSYKLTDIIPGLNQTNTYNVYDLYSHSVVDTLKAHQNLKLSVNTSGSVRIVKLVPILK